MALLVQPETPLTARPDPAATVVNEVLDGVAASRRTMIRWSALFAIGAAVAGVVSQAIG